MKHKIVFINKNQMNKWVAVANSLANSLCLRNVALQQFNQLSPKDRIEIKKRFDECDIIRRTKIPKTEGDAWLLGIMVDAHIIATEFGVDPLTVTMCVCAPCKPSERVIVK